MDQWVEVIAIHGRQADVPFTTSSVRSVDGTAIGYRCYGLGPAVVLVHGGMMAAQDLQGLAVRLAERRTVVVPDLRGRGTSGAFTDDHSLQKEVEDLGALLEATGARAVFALSAGAVFALAAALQLPAIAALAVYEPPFPLSGQASTIGWLPDYERRLAAGDLGGALVTVARGTGDSSLLSRLPRRLTGAFFNFVIPAQAAETGEHEVSLRDRVVSVGRDARVVASTRDRLREFSGLATRMLLMRGTRSPRNLQAPIDVLHQLLPEAEFWVLRNGGHLTPVRGRGAAAVARRLEQFLNAAADD